MSNHGLRGHETVIRLVGKRRKLTLSAISPKTSDSRDVKHEVISVVTSDGTNTEPDFKTQSTGLKSITYLEEDIRLQSGVGEASALVSTYISDNIHGNGVATEQEVGHISWVKCPICEKSIRGDVINTHLDVCLQGGMKDMKRKSKQLTKSQFGGSMCAVGFQRMTTREKQAEFGL